MSSVYFRIEAYGNGAYGCPEYDLMGYTNIDLLIKDCWDKRTEEMRNGKQKKDICECGFHKNIHSNETQDKTGIRRSDWKKLGVCEKFKQKK